MTSVGSVIAQNPYRANYFVSFGTAASTYPVASVEALAPTGVVSGATTQVININTVTNAIATSSGALLNGAASLTAGALYRDMGREVHVQVNGFTVYTLSKVQEMTGSATEGVGGSASASAGLTGYNTYYVCTFSSDAGNASGGGATPAVGVARVGGH
jgi:hypothetical protein